MLKILAQLISGLLGDELQSTADRAKTSAICGVLVALLVSIGAIFVLIAAFLGLSQLVSPAIAALILAGSAFLIALVIYVGWRASAQKKKLQQQQQLKAKQQALMASAAVAVVPSLFKKPVLFAALPLLTVALIALNTKKKNDNSK